jgi:hypothetical protein
MPGTERVFNKHLLTLSVLCVSVLFQALAYDFFLGGETNF